MKKIYTKENSGELSLHKDEIVFVKSLPVDGWVFSENMDKECGYVPFCCLDPIFLPEHEVNMGKVIEPQSTDPSVDTVTIRRRSITLGESHSKEYLFCYLVISSSLTDKPKIRSTKRSHTHSLSIQSSQSDTSCTLFIVISL